MPYAIMLAISIHALAAVFWAGTSFVFARSGDGFNSSMFRAQMGAATLAVLSGIYLWGELHAAAFGDSEAVLAVGAGSAIVAAGFEGALCGPALRAIRQGRAPAQPTARIAIGQRAGAALLAIALICMVISRYV